MTQETAQERIYREALETLAQGGFAGERHVKRFVNEVFKQIESLPVSTDRLSSEILQKENASMRKALEEIMVITIREHEIHSLRSSCKHTKRRDD